MLKIAKDFYDLFPAKQRRQIAFFYLHPELKYGINQYQLSQLYQMTKVFMFFSKTIKTRFFTFGEGDSRVISEALCCGLPVVCSNSLRGGGKDFLTEDNSVCFDSFATAHEALLEAREKFPNGIKDNPEKITREDYSLERLHGYLSEFYKKHDQNYDGILVNSDQLDQRLPGHYYDVPWKIDPKKPTADISSRKQFEIFLNHLEQECKNPKHSHG